MLNDSELPLRLTFTERYYFAWSKRSRVNRMLFISEEYKSKINILFIRFLSVSEEINLHQWSDSTDGRVKEDTAREVRVAPLRERRLLLEVALDCGEVLRVKHIVILLIGRLELLEVFYRVVVPSFPTRPLRAFKHL